VSEAGNIEEVEGHLLVLEKVQEHSKKFARAGIITLLSGRLDGSGLRVLDCRWLGSSDGSY